MVEPLLSMKGFSPNDYLHFKRERGGRPLGKRGQVKISLTRRGKFIILNPIRKTLGKEVRDEGLRNYGEPKERGK